MALHVLLPFLCAFSARARQLELQHNARSLAVAADSAKLNASAWSLRSASRRQAHASYAEADASSALAALTGADASSALAALTGADSGISASSSKSAAAAAVAAPVTAETNADRAHVAQLVGEPIQVTPEQFLFVSSPTLRKVLYVQLRNFKAVEQLGMPLITSGLVEPCGLAFDGRNGGLYVADRAQKKIFRYTVTVKGNKDHPGSSIIEAQMGVTVLTGTDVEWVSVDLRGDVFYSDQTSNSIGRIPLATIEELTHGINSAEGLSFVSQKEKEKTATTATHSASQPGALGLPAEDPLKTTPDNLPDKPMEVYVLYQGSVNPNVGTPGGVASDGRYLYWANTNGGAESGTVCKGDLQPKLANLQSDHYQAQALSNNSEHGYGVAKTNLMVVYTASTGPGAGGVYGMYDNGAGGVQAFASTLSDPRGLAWDGDQTVYVADTGSGKVYSLPVGRLANELPKTEVVQINGAYGLALVNSESPSMIEVYKQASAARRQTLSTPLVLAAMASLWVAGAAAPGISSRAFLA